MIKNKLIAIAILIGLCPMVYGQGDSVKVPVQDGAEIARIAESLGRFWKIEYDTEGRPISAKASGSARVPSISKKRIDLVCQLTSLESLSFAFSHVDLEEMPPLENLKNLKHFAMWGFAPSDISVLKNCPDLVSLELSGGSLTSIDTLRNLTQLEKIDIPSLKSEDLSPLNGLDRLRVAELEKGSIKDISIFNRLKNLESINFDQSQLNTTPRDLPRLKHFIAAGTEIADASGLATCPELEVVDLSSTQTNSIEWTRPLKKLKKVEFPSSLVNDLSPLSGRVDLDLGSTLHRLEGRDLSPLDGFRKLGSEGKMSLFDSRTETLPNITHAEDLVTLYLRGTKVADLEPIRFNQLRNLCIEDSPVRDLSPLELSNFEQIGLINLPCDDLSPLKKMDQTTYLEVSGLPITDLSPISSMAELRTLILTGHRVRDFSVVSSLTNLHTVGISNLSQSDLVHLANLPIRTLMLPNSKITDLSGLAIADLQRLRWLDLANSEIENIELLKHCTSLEGLSLEGTKVRDISVLSSLPKLEVLNLKNSSITKLIHLPIKTIDLTGTEVTNIRPIAEANNICLAYSKVRNFRPLQKSKRLYDLDLSGLPVDFRQINGTSIGRLNLSHAKINLDVPLSIKTTSFAQINLSHSNIRDLGSLHVKSLEELDLSFTEIKDLQPLLQLDRLKRIRIEGIDVEPELLAQIQAKLEQRYSHEQDARILREVTPVEPFIRKRNWRWFTSPEW